MHSPARPISTPCSDSAHRLWQPPSPTSTHEVHAPAARNPREYSHHRHLPLTDSVINSCQRNPIAGRSHKPRPPSTHTHTPGMHRASSKQHVATGLTLLTPAPSITPHPRVLGAHGCKHPPSVLCPLVCARACAMHAPSLPAAYADRCVARACMHPTAQWPPISEHLRSRIQHPAIIPLSRQLLLTASCGRAATAPKQRIQTGGNMASMDG
jgi:hypothetical protein